MTTLLQLARLRGFVTVTDYADQKPTMPLYMVADELGTTARDLELRLRSEAVAEGDESFTWFARTSLIRRLHELKGGWSDSVETSGRLVAWTLGLRAPPAFEPVCQTEIETVIERLERIAPEGWKPGVSDPVLDEAFEGLVFLVT